MIVVLLSEPVDDGLPAGTGWAINDDASLAGRPVGVSVDRHPEGRERATVGLAMYPRRSWSGGGERFSRLAGRPPDHPLDLIVDVPERSLDRGSMFRGSLAFRTATRIASSSR